MERFYVTVAIPYVNSKPHVGYLYELVCGDVLARWHGLKGEDVFFLAGTDENATKNAQAAKELGIPTRKFVDQNSKLFDDLTKAYNISNTNFIRTIDPKHIKIAQEIYTKAYEKGDIYKGYYEGYYCQGCEAFLTDKDLVSGKCPEHKTEPKWLKEENYFFKMSKYKDRILKLLANNFVVPDEKRREVYTRAKEGLSDFSVSRYKQEWGIDVPFDKDHKIYVWYDALLCYISGIDYPNEKFKKYWPADVQIIGKGINWFHSVIWSAILMSAELPLPKKIAVHGYLTSEGEKMSKSLGNVLDPIELALDYGVDQIRYYLLREIPFGQDGDFSTKKLKDRVNGELVKELGNLVSRSLKLTEKVKGKIEGKAELKIDLKQINKYMDKFELHHALNEIFIFIKHVNKYINDTEPWKLDGKELSNAVYNLCESLRIIAILLHPFIPNTSDKILNQLGVKLGSLNDCIFKKFEGKPKLGGHLFELIQ